jgi:hypothetical protein
VNLTEEQRAFAGHPRGAFVEACPGAGKTATIVARIARISSNLPARRGVAVLSFTNSAIEEFITQCHALELNSALRHPGFVGTFDSFLRQFFFAPSGIEGVSHSPTVVDSWETLSVDVRLRGSSAFRGDGATLDWFDPETGQIDPVSIGHSGLRAHVIANRAAYEMGASRQRFALRNKGYLSAADVRVDVVRRLQRADWSSALGRAIAARFQEVIVDEAQDCNPLDCQIIHWLLNSGVTVTVVADPDQAIYGFRHGNPTGLRDISNSYQLDDRLPMTGNFRSSPAICSFAATLRTRSSPDTSLGETSEIAEPVHILSYTGSSVTAAIGDRFCQLMAIIGIPKTSGIILAHSRKNALRACGSCAEEEAGNSNLAGFAGAVATFWSASVSSRARESALRVVERSILELMGMIDANEVPTRAAERRQIDPRWLRRNALELISQIPRYCDNTNEARTAWVSALCAGVQRLRLTYREGITERQYFPNRADGIWHRLLVIGQATHLKNATIHEAKGKAYSAVCVVIPPDRGQPRRTEQLITNWQGRIDHEAKRVIYVGITRARTLASIAIPSIFKARVMTLMGDSRVNFLTHDL